MRKIKKKTMEILKKKGNVLIILALLIVAIVSFYFYKTNRLKNAQKPNTSDGEISLLYFYSDAMGTSTISKVCPATDNINWEVANLVLSDYMEYGEGSSTQEFGPAEIQRNFEENCDRNMKIYNDKLTKNPTMECDMSESSGAYNNCVDGLYQSFKKLQESKYKEYLKKLDGFINETELCQAFSYDSIKEGIIKWHSQVDSYLSNRCFLEQRVSTSATIDLETKCKVKFYKENVEFLQNLIDETHEGYKPVNGACG
ncbi:MAG: hypothetical protein NTZ36_02070 [Candidatus Jorgensenbacteria bacterium]|nr:hypothetical protein [Candidatus Jorgensenbacteria bacterium]